MCILYISVYIYIYINKTGVPIYLPLSLRYKGFKVITNSFKFSFISLQNASDSCLKLTIQNFVDY